MRLEDFLKQGGTKNAVLAPTKPVSFKGIGLTNNRQQFTFDATAQLVFVDEEETARIRSAARVVHPSAADRDLFNQEVAYRTLAVALRDADDPAVMFAKDHVELRKALIGPEATRLINAYAEFVEKEFNPQPSAEQVAEMAEEAEGNS